MGRTTVSEFIDLERDTSAVNTNPSSLITCASAFAFATATRRDARPALGVQ